MRRDERGATAVEYGLIAGLIAIGIVGSLVSTRTSLNSVFGNAATKMGSATTTTKPPYTGPTFNPMFARSPFWSGKTLSSGPTIDRSSTSYSQVSATFTDGTQVYYTQYADGRQTINVRDGSTLYMWSVGTDASGKMNDAQLYHYTDASFTHTDVYYYSGNYDSNGTPTSMTTVRCSGSCTSSSGSPSAQYIQSYQNGVGDLAVYNNILTR